MVNIDLVLGTLVAIVVGMPLFDLIVVVSVEILYLFIWDFSKIEDDYLLIDSICENHSENEVVEIEDNVVVDNTVIADSANKDSEVVEGCLQISEHQVFWTVVVHFMKDQGLVVVTDGIVTIVEQLINSISSVIPEVVLV